MNRKTIQGSEYSDTNLKHSVCSHLKQILEFMIENGNSFDRSKPLQVNSREGGATLVVDKPIDFDSIRDAFEIPSYIEMNQKYRAIICRRCWCDISEKGNN